MEPLLLDLGSVRVESESQVSPDIHRVSVPLVSANVRDLRMQRLLDSDLGKLSLGIASLVAVTYPLSVFSSLSTCDGVC